MLPRKEASAQRPERALQGSIAKCVGQSGPCCGDAPHEGVVPIGSFEQGRAAEEALGALRETDSRKSGSWAVGLKVKTQDWVVSTEATKTDSGPTFFVLTPTYNRAERLLSAIESVRNQSYADCHHFILDDGSSDETPQILDRFSADPQIDTWRFDINGGVNEARNFLLERILEQGKAGFVVILDDDDRLEKDCLSRFAEAARALPSGRWFIGNCLYPNGRAITQVRGGSEPLC
jgi:hypothetical protein